jgi:hypothetical protein
MTKSSVHSLTLSTIGIGLVWLTVAVPASADNHIQTCNDTCAVNCSGIQNCRTADTSKICALGSNLLCNSGDGPITLRDNTTLDLAGFSLTCPSNGTCNDAVFMTSGSGSKVVNNLNSNESVIMGPFFSGVNCNLNSPSVVGGSSTTGITIANTLYGVINCKTVTNNVIKGLGRTFDTVNVGIKTSVISNSDVFDTNYIADKSYAIEITGTKSIAVRNNVIHTTLWTNCAVQVTNTNSTASILNNTILGVGNAGFGSLRVIMCNSSSGLYPPPSGMTFAGNICDRDHPDCTNCGNNGVCVPFVSPFAP